MINSIKMSLKVYLRSIRLVVPYLAFVAASIVTLINLYKYYTTAVDFLTDSLKLGILCFCYFAFAAYELSALLRHVDGEESVMYVQGSCINLSIAHVIILTGMLVVWTLFLTTWQIVVCFLQDVSYFSYTIHCILAFTLYFFIPGLIGILLGSCLQKCNRPITYFVIICSSIFSSSIPMEYFSSTKIGDVSIASILDWFYITVPNANWVADSVYGIPMETCCWVLRGFWLVLLCLIFTFIHRCNTIRIRRIVIGFLMVLLFLLGIRFGDRADDFVLRKDYRPEGIIQGELSYRSEVSGENITPDFVVSNYDIHLMIDDCLWGEVTVFLESSHLDEYRFTLFHDYNVLSVTDTDGNNIAFSRNGDYLDIKPDNQVSSITVTYQGSAWKYYANQQAIFLPAYAAYYPVPGHHSVWDFDQSAINTEYRAGKTTFSVEVDSHLQVLSNLSLVGENRFKGDAEGVSLFAGFVESKNSDVVTVYQSFLDRRICIDSASISNAWKKLASRVGESREFNITGKIIFVQPLTVASIGGSNEAVVVYDDHILLSGNQMSEEDICCNYLLSLIPNTPQKTLLREAFSFYLFSSTQPSGSIKPSYESLKVLKKYGHHSEITNEEEWFEYVNTADLTFYQLFEYQLATLGQEYVMRNVYEYLLDEGNTANQVDFIFYLGCEDDA